MEGYRGHTGSSVQDFEGCCILHWNFLKGSCGFWILSTVCRVILRILDLANCFAVGSFGSWILYPGYVMGKILTDKVGKRVM